MTSAEHVLGAWIAVLGAGAVYAYALVRRGRRLSARVDPSRRRWMTATPAAPEPAPGAAETEPGAGGPVEPEG